MTRSEYLRQWRLRNPERARANRERWRNANREKTREITNRSARALREEVVAGYGDKCECCGETEFAFLTIDHVHGDGASERRRVPGSYRFLKRLRDENYPAQYRLLCWNCNSGRAVNGGICPHEAATRI